jgi:hypothetical protein
MRSNQRVLKAALMTLLCFFCSPEVFALPEPNVLFGTTHNNFSVNALAYYDYEPPTLPRTKIHNVTQ